MAEARIFSPERPGQHCGRSSLIFLGHRVYFQVIKRPEPAAGIYRCLVARLRMRAAAHVLPLNGFMAMTG